MFHTNLIKAPALLILSKTDPIGAESSNLRAKESWENMGIEVIPFFYCIIVLVLNFCCCLQVFWKCFENSPHVGHMQKYPQEYMNTVSNFLEHIGVASNVQKIQAKL